MLFVAYNKIFSYFPQTRSQQFLVKKLFLNSPWFEHKHRIFLKGNDSSLLDFNFIQKNCQISMAVSST
jgi:hypothetical protein